MISLGEINRVANKYQVPAETIEKDYIISWILWSLSKSDIKDHFIFYGGTALKKIYFEDHRFSEDIDLISDKGFSKNQLLQFLLCIEKIKEVVFVLLHRFNVPIVQGELMPVFYFIALLQLPKSMGLIPSIINDN